MSSQDKFNSINQFTDYRKTDRIKTNYVLQTTTTTDLVFSNENIKHQETIIPYDKIDKIKLSMCSRIYNPGVISKGPIDFIVKSWKNGTLATVPTNLIYSLDIDIYVKDGNLYAFEGIINKNIHSILELLNCHNIVIEDSIGIQDIVKKCDDYREIQVYMDKHFKDLSKQYGLDNPRGTYVLK